MLSAGTPPGWQGAGTPGFARAASGAVELPFSRREAIALRFGTEDALLDAELTVQLGGADALGWSATRWREVLDEINGLNAIVQSDCAAAAAGSDVDWRAIEALMRILDDPPSFTVTQPNVFRWESCRHDKEEAATSACPDIR